MEHQTKKIFIKEIEVDVGIEPVVRWLNSMDSVFTLYSCQGDPSGTPSPSSLPYIRFMAQGNEHLPRITAAVVRAACSLRPADSITISTSTDFYGGCVARTVHDVHCSSQEALDALKRAIKDGA
jgi:hypothetical protein